MSDSNEKYVELMHAAVDGEASHEQLSTLREYMAGHGEAQREHAELEQLTGILNRVEAVEIPVDLHKSIMKALPREGRSADFGIWRSRSRFRIPMLRYGFALAAGVVLGAVLTGVTLKNLSPDDKSDVYGTMASVTNAQHSGITEQMKLVAPDLGGTVGISHLGTRELVVFDMNTSQAVEVEVRFDGGGAGVVGFSQQPNGISSFEVKEDSIRFRSQGKQSSTLLLSGEKPGSHPLNFSLYVQGKLVQEGRLGAAAPEGSGK